MNALLDHICYWIDGTCVVVDCFNTKNTKKNEHTRNQTYIHVTIVSDISAKTNTYIHILVLIFLPINAV